MSTGCKCSKIEVATDKWYYLLEDRNAPKNAWDWRDHATAYGPFPTDEAADQHLSDNHPNPGGSSTIKLPAGEVSLDLEKDPVLKQLIETAVAPISHAQRFRW